MWIVFDNQEDWLQGYSVNNEAEALEICNRNSDMTYQYVDMCIITA